jgi:ABC-type multidrug transport system fused ATPase/permease subunit
MLKKVFNLLDYSGKKKFIFLFLLILFTGFIDVLGVVSILPFIAVLSNFEIVETNNYLNKIYKLSKIFGVLSIKQFLTFMGLCTFFVIVISLITRAFSQFFQTRFSYMCEYNLSKRLINNYLSQPYIWFLNKNPSDLSKNIFSEVQQLVGSTITPFIKLLSNLIIILLLLLLLFFFDPIVSTSVILVLGLCYVCIFYFVKKKLHNIGLERVRANQERFNMTFEAIGAIKEVKLLGLEQIFVDRFKKPAKIYAVNQTLAELISLLPRYFIEGIAFGGMIILILFLITHSASEVLLKVIPIISLYVFVGYRIIPSFQQIYIAITQLRYSSSSLDLIHKDLIKLKVISLKNINNKLTFKKFIKLNNISFSYPDIKRASLKNINLTIPVLSKVGIIGPTGSGKSTLVDIILGLIEPSSGNMTVDDVVISENNKISWQKNIGYVPQQIYLSDTSILSNIAFGQNINSIDYRKVERAAKLANLHEFVMNELNAGYETVVGDRGIRLSGGQRQRIGIARALYNQPQVLIFDEATNALDDQTEDTILENIRNLNFKSTVIIISHRQSTINDCDIIFLLEQGRLKVKKN